MDEFAHLHVASGFSMRYGASTPEALVERAAQYGQPALALTDRDGLYGAVRFVRAATAAGITPVLGVDLAVEEPTPPRRPARMPVRGGALVDPRRPRITVLARGSASGVAHGVGWAALCRLVTATHLRGERGVPVLPPDLLLPADSPLVVLLGPDSDVGRALLANRRDRAEALLAAWEARMPRAGLVVEVVCHRGPDGTPASRRHARALLALADAHGITAVLTAAVRHVDPADSRVVDVLDAARRLVTLDPRHLDRMTDAGHLASTVTMHLLAREVCGPDPERADRLVADTMRLALECGQDARRDLGIGSVQLPEPGILGIRDGEDP